MEVLLHGHNSDSLLRSLHWSDAFTTAGTLGSEDAVEVIDAVDLVVEVYREGDTVQTIIADAAAEAARVVSLANSLQYALHDEMATDLTLL